MEFEINQNEFNYSFENYIAVSDQILNNNNVPPQIEIRVFDVRFRIAIGLRISLDVNYARVNTENTRNTYKLILSLNEFWFAYEGFSKYYKIIRNTANNRQLTNLLTDEDLVNERILILVNTITNLLRDQIFNNERLKNDFINFLEYLISYSRQGQQNLLKRLKLNFCNNEDLSLSEILSLIYSIRCMYVHNGHTAKSGVKFYKTKILVLKICKDFMTLFLLIISKNVMEEELAILGQNNV